MKARKAEQAMAEKEEAKKLKEKAREAKKQAKLDQLKAEKEKAAAEGEGNKKRRAPAGFVSEEQDPPVLASAAAFTSVAVVENMDPWLEDVVNCQSCHAAMPAKTRFRNNACKA